MTNRITRDDWTDGWEHGRLDTRRYTWIQGDLHNHPLSPRDEGSDQTNGGRPCMLLRAATCRRGALIRVSGSLRLDADTHRGEILGACVFSGEPQPGGTATGRLDSDPPSDRRSCRRSTRGAATALVAA